MGIPDQIYAFTERKVALPGEYVKFVQAFIDDNGDIEVRIRNDLGKTTSITMSKDDAKEFGQALIR